MHPTLEARNWPLVSWKTAIALVVVGAVFVFGIGNIGGKNGNPSWLIGPLCVLLLIALGITAFVRSRRNKSVA
jgi:peptidoglycan/LPS O-acetylase OafA/YrhL